jgi:glycosyltransferase involved in cell wall biosynthesis
MDIRFSVVVPVLDLRGSIDLLLRCLEAQLFPRDRFECIIVDDGSRDGTGEFLDAYTAGFALTVVHNAMTRGRSVARNVGCARARGEILVFLDGDMLPSPAWLLELDEGFRGQDVEVLSGGRYSIAVDPRCVHATLSALVGVPAGDLFLGDGVAAQFNVLGRRARLGQYPTPLYQRLETELEEVCREYPSSAICAFSLITSNVAVYRHAFEKTNRFCAFIVRLQDTELGLQLWEAGCRFGFAGAAAAYHLFHPVFVDIAANYQDVVAMFHRHPYTSVLAMACWGLHRAPLASKPRLRELAERGMSVGEVSRTFVETFNEPAPVACHYRWDEIVDYAAEQARLPREEIVAWLQQGLAQGLCADAVDGAVFLDRHHTFNWLQNNTPFREIDRRQSCCGTNVAILREPRHDDGAVVFACSGRYEVTVPRDLFAASAEDVTMCLPVPVCHAAQTELELRPFRTEGVFEQRSADRIAYSWRAGALDEDIVVGYDFSCDLHETRIGSEETAANEDLAPFLHTALSGRYLTRAETWLRQVGLEPTDGPFRKARAIYTWVLDHYAFRESALSPVSVFETGVGPCTHAATLFVELCRLAGIPARERCGALLQKIVEGGDVQSVATLERGYSPFMHTWSEFNDPERGWVSVEFLGWMLGARSLSVRNVEDKELRRRMRADSAWYDSYFFGQLDPFRVRSAPTSNRLRTYPVLKSSPSWPAIRRAALATRHRLTCTLARRVAAMRRATVGREDRRQPVRAL